MPNYTSHSSQLISTHLDSSDQIGTNKSTFSLKEFCLVSFFFFLPASTHINISNSLRALPGEDVVFLLGHPGPVARGEPRAALDGLVVVLGAEAGRADPQLAHHSPGAARVFVEDLRLARLGAAVGPVIKMIKGLCSFGYEI